MSEHNPAFIHPENEATYWMYRVKKAADYLAYCKEMHQKAIKHLAHFALREQARQDEDGLTEQEWLGHE